MHQIAFHIQFSTKNRGENGAPESRKCDGSVSKTAQRKYYSKLCNSLSLNGHILGKVLLHSWLQKKTCNLLKDHVFLFQPSMAVQGYHILWKDLQGTSQAVSHFKCYSTEKHINFTAHTYVLWLNQSTFTCQKQAVQTTIKHNTCGRRVGREYCNGCAVAAGTKPNAAQGYVETALVLSIHGYTHKMTHSKVHIMPLNRQVKWLDPHPSATFPNLKSNLFSYVFI